MQNRKASTVNKYLHYVFTIWDTAKYQWGITLPTQNPVALVKKEKVTTHIERILTKQEYQNLLIASENSNLSFLKDIIQFAYTTAMRFGEITKLEVKDIDFEKSLARLRDTKNGEDRIVPLTDEAVAICLRYRFRNKLFEINSSISLFLYSSLLMIIVSSFLLMISNNVSFIDRHSFVSSKRH